MGRIDADFERLQPVAVPVALEGERVLAGCDECIEVRKRRCLAFAEIGEEDAALLLHGIGAQPYVLAQAATGGLRRRLQAISIHIQETAVEPAAPAALFESSLSAGGAAI